MSISFIDAGMFHVEHIPGWFYRELKNIPLVQKSAGNQGGRDKVYYKDCITAFDIETTRIHDYTPEQLDEARAKGAPLSDDTTMYIWQWCFTWNISKNPDDKVYKEVVIYGRTWKGYKEFVKNITMNLPSVDRFVVYDHNFSYEFQFLRSVLKFYVDAVFSVKARQPIKAVAGNLEFRCSYKQSNMSLRKFAEQMKTPHQKTEMDYDKKRYWYTPLSPDELTYAVNDVYCLAECMVLKMEQEGDNLYTIPLTSTGYVRRDVKKAVNEQPYTLRKIRQMMPEYDVYEELKEAFRGGNTHANRYFSGEHLTGTIHSADRSSSYPAVICNREYPMSKFEKVVNNTVSNVIKLMDVHKRAILARVQITGVKLKNKFWGCPYISLSKCRNITGEVLDNGRVLSADYLEITVTDVDLRIIFDEYEFNKIMFYDVYSARYGKIPQVIIDKVIEYYQKKTSLKGVAGMEYYYMKNKNLLNSIYGMMVQDLVKLLIIYTNGADEGSTGEFVIDETESPNEILKKAEKKGFLNYAWGVWVTAWARYELERGIKLVHDSGADFIYCDTDSVKYMGDVDWTDYNNEKITESMNSGSHATDPKGNEHYMGVFEAEHDMTEFITMGAKKYAYIDASDGKLTITVAGVGKKSGAKELLKSAEKDNIPVLDEFREGYTFIEAGGLEAVYNDKPYTSDIPLALNEETRAIEMTSNVTLRPSTYTLGLTNEYRELLEGLDYENGDDGI